MERVELSRLTPDLLSLRAGAPQRSGPMTVVPLFGRRARSEFAPPLSTLKLAAVRGYGNMELEHSGAGGVAIVPLHMGYIQDNAQNHALCRAAFLGAGQKLMFRDACCVQQAQGGYLAERQQWFFVLPLPLRAEALALRGQEGFGKLWPAIGRLNAKFKMEARGHLEQLVSRRRSYLTQFVSRFELLPEQTGALFFVNGRLAGVELGPSPEYFAEVWMPLVCFSYGPVAMYEETLGGATVHRPALAGETVEELRRELARERDAEKRRLLGEFLTAPGGAFDVVEEERFLSLRLFTAVSERFAGQVVKDGDDVVYASLAATPAQIGWAA